MVKKAVKRVTKTRAVNSVFETVANHYGISLEDLLAYPKNVRDLMIEKAAGLPTKEPKVNSGKRITADQVRSWIPANRLVFAQGIPTLHALFRCRRHDGR